jgi:hypothetical protein
MVGAIHRRIGIRVTFPWIPEQSESHAGLLNEARTVSTRARFDAIFVPTHRPVAHLQNSIGLARRTQTPLIVACSREVNRKEVIDRAARANVEAFAFDLPPESPLKIKFKTSEDEELSAASLDWSRDLSMKRNIGLVLARLLGWTRLMFLDDDIYSVRQHDVTALAGALNDYAISAFIPRRYPDNSVVCHANRLGGGKQDVFASASGMGVRSDRDDLAFFPNLYNEDWFFFADEAANHRIAIVGKSRQRGYDPYEHPRRAACEEFGDLIAEGLYARLDINEGIWQVDTDYWQDFIKRRMDFHERVREALGRVDAQHKDEAARADISIHTAQDQLSKITPELCQKFVQLWQDDLTEWRNYLSRLPRLHSLAEAFEYLGIDPRS